MTFSTENASAKRKYAKPLVERVEFVAEEAVFSYCKTESGTGNRFSAGVCSGSIWGAGVRCSNLGS
jgi:hypothetical protein